MKLAIIGSRDLNVNIKNYLYHFNNIEMIITGGAFGIDQCAENYAINNNIELKVIRPDYENLGRRAPIVRNTEIVDLADAVLAFWDGESKGTNFTIQYAKKKNKHVVVYSDFD